MKQTVENWLALNLGALLCAVGLSYAAPIGSALGADAKADPMLAGDATDVNPAGNPESGSYSAVVRQAQRKVVKITGAGGVRGLEAYQSGFLISAEGHVLTAWSYVLDTDAIIVTMDDGGRYPAKLTGADPATEIAVLKIEGAELPHFDLHSAATANSGSRILALSNLFGVATGDEPVSVQHGIVAAKTRLDARRGIFKTPYLGPVYVIDAITNNPGAAGGALVDTHGQLLGMLGKELRNSQTNTWLNYALPIGEIATNVDEIISGRFSPRKSVLAKRLPGAVDARELGIVLVPDVLERTPPFVETVRPDSLAAKAGLQPDDLIIFVGSSLVQSVESLTDELANTERDSNFTLVVMRDQAMVTIKLHTPEKPPGNALYAPAPPARQGDDSEERE